jgi:hypothetical protein
MNARLTPTIRTKVAADRPAAMTVAVVGAPCSSTMSKTCAAIIQSKAIARATSTPVMRVARAFGSAPVVTTACRSGWRGFRDPSINYLSRRIRRGHASDLSLMS